MQPLYIMVNYHDTFVKAPEHSSNVDTLANLSYQILEELLPEREPAGRIVIAMAWSSIRRPGTAARK